MIYESEKSFQAVGSPNLLSGKAVHYMPHLRRLELDWKELPQNDLDAKREMFITEHKRSTKAIAMVSALEGLRGHSCFLCVLTIHVDHTCSPKMS